MKTFRRFIDRTAHPTGLPVRSDPDPINNYFLTSAPSPQNAVDILKGAWSTSFPSPLQSIQAGTIGLFEDARIEWLISELGDLKGRFVLELGPLEGGHSYMLERAGAASVTAVEANTHAYLKCLIAKELLGMPRVKYLCGDFIEYMKNEVYPPFDLGVASGVLYHMINPVELISLLAGCCQKHLFLWTHYYDGAWAKDKGLQEKFPSSQQVNFNGFSHTLVRQNYSDAQLGSASFCGGSRPYSNWMYREEIIRCLEYFGFADLRINFDEPDHPHGPAFALIASRD
jgi:hypothetical protein